jgi:maltose 6'-phosphate phosphatase
MFSLLLPHSAAAWWWWGGGTRCDDVADRGYLNVLSFNILFFSEVKSVEERLVPIVDFVKGFGEPIDLIFLQEVVGGKLALSGGTTSAQLLKEMLSQGPDGVEYNLRTAFEVGVPGVFYTGNATLSRCKIKYSFVKRLPREFEIEILGHRIKLPRNVQMTRIKIPGFGKFSAYNTHLCAFCCPSERQVQLIEMLDFIEGVENFIPGDNPVILAGDFNIDRFRLTEPGCGSDRDLYDQIIAASFNDAYADANGEDLDDLCSPDDPPHRDVHCTVEVTALDSPYGTLGTPRRIDYIFEQDFSTASAGMVYFNPVVGGSPTEVTSDHAAVFVKIWLP